MRAILVLATLLVGLLTIPTVAASDDLPTGTRVDGNCVWVYEWADAGYAICTGRDDCPLGLYTKTVTIAGGEERCLL